MIQLKSSPGVALVYIDGRRVGSVRRFGSKWRAKFDSQPEYPEAGYATRAEAAESLTMNGLTRREFQKILLTAQSKRGREPLTEQEQEVWDLAMGDPASQEVFR